MMIQRNLINDLRRWATKAHRKPLVIRGARQVGKTTLVKEFAKDFDECVMLNLERPDDRQIFAIADTPAKVMDILRLTRMKSTEKGKRTLLFIDEIQSEPKAVGMLRYFYEDMPELFVIAAGSRLQELFKSGVSFPVGRVEYMAMRPCFFDEFLDALGYTGLKEQIKHADVEPVLHSELIKLFHQYALIGGMPEVISQYAETHEISSLSPLYQGLLMSYNEDVEKYASTQQQVSVLRHLLSRGWDYAGQTVTFARFGGSSYTSTAVHQGFELLEKAFIMSLDFPITSVKAPAQESMTRSPKLIWLDSGLVNFSAGIQVDYMSNTSLADVWRGHAVEQVIGQQLWEVLDRNYINRQNFWVRDKRGSNAEVDFILPYAGKIIPIEVKCGINSHLRSLQSFMATEGACGIAVRLWPGELSIDDVINPQTSSSFRLVNVPYYLVGQLDKIIEKYI